MRTARRLANQVTMAKSRTTKSSLNAVYTQPGMRRRYEVWFMRLGLADGSGAWWFRYLLMNLARCGCAGNPRGMPVQVWATWFPRGGAPQSFIRGFSAEKLSLSARGSSPFRFTHGENRVGEDSCSGQLSIDGHYLRWDLRYRSTFALTLGDRGWLGFSRTPHSDAIFSGEIVFDGRVFRGEPLGYGLQGHNSGYRHRKMWNWTHTIFPDANGAGLPSFEAFEYEMPLGRRTRNAVLWTAGEQFAFTKFENVQRDPENLRWNFDCANRKNGTRIVASVDGSGASIHRLPYLKTDCSGTFEVANNSLAHTKLTFSRPGRADVDLETDYGAVLEMVGS
jgi:hypothetical protein